jgi:hypothetical protein
MAQVLLRAFSFTLIIVIGIVLRGTGFVSEDAGATVKKILINVTLPAAIITNFSAIDSLSPVMILIAGIGMLTNMIMIAVGVMASGKKASKEDKVLNIMCFPGYNIGAFCLPFVQSFLPAVGSVTACMMDVGNSIMCTGVTYAFAAEYTGAGSHDGEKKGFDFVAFGKRLIKSAPLDSYVLMFILSLAGLHLPDAVLTLIEPAAKANSFVAMMMLGLLFHLELKKEYIAKVVKILLFRNGFAVIFAAILYLALPFELPIRQALVLLCFAPMSAVAPAFTGMCGGDEGMASCTNSLSILCSLVVITTLIGVLGIHA